MHHTLALKLSSHLRERLRKAGTLESVCLAASYERMQRVRPSTWLIIATETQNAVRPSRPCYIEIAEVVTWRAIAFFTSALS